MTTGELGSWHSDDYVTDWIGADVLADLLALPRRLSAALVADSGHSVEHVVDLGAGHGPYLEVFLDAFPGARGTWVDSSDPMQAAARERLTALEDRIDYVLGDVERLGELELGAADVVVTSRVLHHFSPETLRSFYAGVFELLRPGGFFFNLDHFGCPDDWESRYRRIRRHFTGTPKQELPRHRHDFPLREPADHLRWLEAAGFEPPDTPWRAFFSALLAARKPAGPTKEMV
jgi:trans-aconitate methyltransferase